MGSKVRSARIWVHVACAFACACIVALCASCSPGGSGGSVEVAGISIGGSDPGEASGAEFYQPEEIAVAELSWWGETFIDTTNAPYGYVCAAGTSAARLKFQVTLGEETYNYDLPNDGTPTIFPINMGDGTYTFRIMENVDDSNYVEIDCVVADVNLENEFSPFLVPNIFCQYDADSACVSKARDLTSGSTNTGEAVRDICIWVADNLKYDNAKAEELSGGTGYIPNPDDTLDSKSGICFDYASLSAAMLRSMGIPTKIMTGYVGEDELYHAWIMVYIDGEWHSAQFSVDPNTWSRCDVTFASAGSTKYTGDASAYTDRYTY